MRDENYSHLRIELSKSCNLTCEYCRSTSGIEYINKFGEIATEKIKEIIDEAEKLGFQIIVFTGGGEPFLRKDIIELIEYGTLPKVVLTNGTCIDDKIAKKLGKCEKLSYIKISYDGEVAQEKYRGVGTNKKILDTIKLFDEYSIPYAINAVLTDLSSAYMGKLYDFVLKSSAFSLGIYPIIQQGRAIGNNNIKEPNIEYVAKQSTKLIRKHISLGCPFDLEIENLFVQELLDNNWDDNTIIGHPDNHPCEYQINAITIRLNGDVTQCSRYQDDFGNIYNDTLTNILKSPKRLRYLERKIHDIEKCRSCDFVKLCHGGCTGRKQIMDKNEIEPDIIACEYVKAFKKNILPLLPKETQVRLLN